MSVLLLRRPSSNPPPDLYIRLGFLLDGVFNQVSVQRGLTLWKQDNDRASSIVKCTQALAASDTGSGLFHSVLVLDRTYKHGPNCNYGN